MTTKVASQERGIDAVMAGERELVVVTQPESQDDAMRYDRRRVRCLDGEMSGVSFRMDTLRKRQWVRSRCATLIKARTKEDSHVTASTTTKQAQAQSWSLSSRTTDAAGSSDDASARRTSWSLLIRAGHAGAAAGHRSPGRLERGRCDWLAELSGARGGFVALMLAMAMARAMMREEVRHLAAAIWG